MKSMKAEHERQRRQLWADVWVGTASANDCKSPKVATGWADKALDEFDKRFPREQPTGEAQ